MRRSIALILASLLILSAPGTAFARFSLGRLLKELDAGAAPVSERLLMIRALGGSRRRKATRALGERLDTAGGDPRITAAIVRALGELGYMDATDPLLEAWEYILERRFRKADLPAGFQSLRAELVRALGKIGDIKAVPALRRGMIDGDPLVVRRALEGLARLKDGKSAEYMIHLLSGPDEDVSRAAYEALGELGGQEAGRALRAALESPKSPDRVMAAYGLARMGEAIGVLKLDGYIEEVEGAYREGLLAAGYLARLGRDNGVDYLAGVAGDKESEFRPLAIEVLGESGASRAALPLAALLDDEDAGTRRLAARALGRLRGRRAVAALKRAADDPDADVRAEVRAALASRGYYSPPDGF
ncbi:MAG: HEAT repeat domain-containing protein [Elusimicrobiota bacterium]